MKRTKPPYWSPRANLLWVMQKGIDSGVLHRSESPKLPHDITDQVRAMQRARRRRRKVVAGCALSVQITILAAVCSQGHTLGNVAGVLALGAWFVWLFFWLIRHS